MPKPSLKDLMAAGLEDSMRAHGVEVADAGVETLTAPTRNPARPRAWTIAYNPTTKTVYIVFRDNTWWEYNDIGTDTWLGLKRSNSTSSYLPKLEEECSSHGPAQLMNISAGTLARVSDSSSKASSIQKGDLRNWKSEDFFKEN